MVHAFHGSFIGWLMIQTCLREISVDSMFLFVQSSLKDTACAYWDYEANNEQGSWSTDGCQLQSIVNKTITCHCNHLTNFAAMMVSVCVFCKKPLSFYKKLVYEPVVIRNLNVINSSVEP